jgi:hypothetical protein
MVVASLLLCLCSTGVQAETGCPTLSFFAEPCLEDEQLTEPMPPPPPAVQLFPKDAVAKDTPPALLQMLQQPEARTLAQARQFVRQQQEKQRVLMQVQQLIQQATREQAGPVQQ